MKEHSTASRSIIRPFSVGVHNWFQFFFSKLEITQSKIMVVTKVCNGLLDKVQERGKEQENKNLFTWLRTVEDYGC